MIQTIGRAARNSEGKVILYADKITKSMDKAINETNRRRQIQEEHNKKYNITPTTIKKNIRDVIEATKVADDLEKYNITDNEQLTAEDIINLIRQLEVDMMEAAEQLQFERAAELRDKIDELKKSI